MRYVARPAWFAPTLLGLASLAVLSGAIALIVAPVYTSYNVTARTERIETTINTQPNWNWALQNVELLGDGVTNEDWSGTVRLAAPVDVLIERISFGELRLHVRCKPENGDIPCSTAGNLFENYGQTQRELPHEFDVFIGDISGRADKGTSVLLAIAGDVSLGRLVGIETAGSVGILREGRVTMRGRTIFGAGVFDAGTVALDVGDRFDVTDVDEDSQTLGFVVVDERPAMTAAYRIVGSSATVYRPGGGSYAVATSTLARFMGDPVFRVLAGLLVIASASAQLLISLMQLGKRSVDSADEKVDA